jgi:hypothetical protein
MDQTQVLQLRNVLFDESIAFFVRYISTLDYSHIGLTAKQFPFLGLNNPMAVM